MNEEREGEKKKKNTRFSNGINSHSEQRAHIDADNVWKQSHRRGIHEYEYVNISIWHIAHNKKQNTSKRRRKKISTETKKYNSNDENLYDLESDTCIVYDSYSSKKAATTWMTHLNFLSIRKYNAHTNTHTLCVNTRKKKSIERKTFTWGKITIHFTQYNAKPTLFSLFVLIHGTT